MKSILALILCATGSVLFAQAKIDFTQVLRDAHGDPFMGQADPQPAPPRAYTLGDVAVNALETPIPDDVKLTGEEKFKMDELARLILSKRANPTVEQIATIKARIGKSYSPAMVGAAWRALEGEHDAPPKPTPAEAKK
jgi:hypothetical protein